MKLGIDLGTTRTIVALVDRGNYPVVSFTDPDGDSVEHIPSVVAREGDRLVYGFEAERAASEQPDDASAAEARAAAPEVVDVTVG